MRTKSFASLAGLYLHQAILNSCRSHGERTAVVDTSLPQGDPNRSLSYARYGEIVEALAKRFVRQGIRPGDVIAIYLPNCWEFAAAYHAATLAGAIPTPLNPSYREREVRFQLENSGARILITEGTLIAGMNLGGLPSLTAMVTTRTQVDSSVPFASLLQSSMIALPAPEKSPQETIAALPYSSGTTGLPKGVMLSHSNLITNVYQYLGGSTSQTKPLYDQVLCFLPLYHIYGLNVILNPTLIVGGTLVLMPRFDLEHALHALVEERITYLPQVPPVMNAFCVAAERGEFPKAHSVIGAKSGAAPLAPELARRFTELTGIKVRQGYGMTEASPVTHVGSFESELYRPDTVGQAVLETDCRIRSEDGSDVPDGEPGELVMRGPQFMLGYWRNEAATRAVMRDGWYWSGDVAVRDGEGFYKIVDRRKELIKYKGFPIAPAEVEAVLLEHPAVRDCGVIGRRDETAGEVPCAFVVLTPDHKPSAKLEQELCGWVAEQLSSYKQPRQIVFIGAIPRTASGKILRRELRAGADREQLG
jgi:acyl-CoA synthetase (AMP-forming)/AMP-acid ligase II